MCFFPHLEPVCCSISNCCPVLTVASWPAYRFLKRQVGWSAISISKNFPEFVVVHTVKGFSIVNKAEVDVFLKLSCFFYDPMNVGNVICFSSVFCFFFFKFSMYIWMFSAYVLLKPSLENFEDYFAHMWVECNCAIIWTFSGIVFLWDWDEN